MLDRNSLQREVVVDAKNYKNQLLNWATGVGKSYAFIKIQEALNPELTFLCVSESSHIKNWEEEYRKYNKIDLLNKTEIFCYASLHKYKDRECDLLGNDECHRITDLRASYLASIKTKHVVSLSATTTERERDLLRIIWGSPLRISRVTLDGAISSGILAEPLIVKVPLRLGNNPTETFTVTRGSSKKPIACLYKDRWKYLKNPASFKLVVRCSQFEKYQHLCEQVEFYKQKSYVTGNPLYSLKWKRAGLDRKNYLASLKTPYLKKVLEIVGDKRFICFCGGIKQANEVGSTNVVHSKVKNPQEVIDRFNNREIPSLFAVNMLQEGVNLNGVEVGIITQLDNNIRSFVQRVGRALRNKDNPVVYVLYFANTRDEEYLDKALSGINENYITTLDL